MSLADLGKGGGRKGRTKMCLSVVDALVDWMSF